MSPDLFMRIICMIGFIICIFLVSGFFSNGNNGQGGSYE